MTAAGTLVALTARQATQTIPIVFIAAGDPVPSGLVTSLARPGGNVTGLSLLFTELIGKCLEHLTQAVPGVSRVAVLWEPGAVPERAQREILRETDVAARALGIRLQLVEAGGPTDIDKAFSEMIRGRAGALAVLSTPMFAHERKGIVDLAAKNRLPAVFSFGVYVDAGGLMSYGPDLTDFRQLPRER